MQLSQLKLVLEQQKPLKMKKKLHSSTMCQNFSPILKYKKLLLLGRLWDIFAHIVLVPGDSSKIPTRGRRARNFASFGTSKHFQNPILGVSCQKTGLKNRAKIWTWNAILRAFLRTLGQKRGVAVGFGPKRTSGAIFAKIGVGGRTGVLRSLISSLLILAFWKWNKLACKISSLYCIPMALKRYLW